MNAELRGMDSPDVADLERFRPGDDFNIFIEASIGMRGEAGADLFSFNVCSPSAFAQTVPESGILNGRFTLFMSQYNYAEIERYILRLIGYATGEDWTGIATKLARSLHWEFEDYVEYQEPRQ
jgi:hypothetical protein